MKPLIKYVGGKTKLAAKLASFIPAIDGVYYEPFCGGAALFAYLYQHRLITRAALSDLNRDLIDLYLVVKHDPTSFIGRMREWEGSYSAKGNDGREALYYNVRGDWNSGHRTPDRYVFLKQTSFNGLWRENKKGEMNAPWGKYESPNFYDSENVAEWSKALQVADIQCKSALDVYPQAGDVVYFDPPYHGTFTAYTKDGFNDQLLVRLLQMSRYHSTRGVFCLMSNSASSTDLVREHWPEAASVLLNTSYMINRDATNRKNQTEGSFFFTRGYPMQQSLFQRSEHA